MGYVDLRICGLGLTIAIVFFMKWACLSSSVISARFISSSSSSILEGLSSSVICGGFVSCSISAEFTSGVTSTEVMFVVGSASGGIWFN